MIKSMGTVLEWQAGPTQNHEHGKYIKYVILRGGTWLGKRHYTTMTKITDSGKFLDLTNISPLLLALEHVELWGIWCCFVNDVVNKDQMFSK